uniref:Putative reverse transcriptase-rnase h-integrase n=1 Tax=Moniliophthora roreri TaxID=221103 RepID=A0A0W0G7A7_MONRR
MSSATATASSSSASSSQSAQVLSPVPTVSGEGRYGENITYPNSLKPNPYQLLHLFNSKQYDNQIRAAADQHNRLEPCVKSLFFLRTQRKLFERIIESCSLKIANQVMYACNYQLGLMGPVTVSSTFPYHLHLSMPPPTDPREIHLRPQFLQKVEHIPVVGGEVALEEFEDRAEDDEQENQTPERGNNLPRLSLRSPTPVLTPMMQLVNHISALCVDWNAISPNIAHSTCVIDASKLNLDIHLATVLNNEGLAVLCTEGLIQVQTLCQMITVMTMSPMTISEENIEEMVQEYDRDAQLLFIGADSRKVRLLSVDEWMAAGWQPTVNLPDTPRMGTVDKMPDMSYDYDAELYGDGES